MRVVQGQIEQIPRFSTSKVDSVDALGVLARQPHLHLGSTNCKFVARAQ
jgi:hypothetical protein